MTIAVDRDLKHPNKQTASRIFAVTISLAWPTGVKMNISQKGKIWDVCNVASLPSSLNINQGLQKVDLLLRRPSSFVVVLL